MSKLEIALLAGADSKQFLVDLTHQIDRLEKLTQVMAKDAAPYTDKEPKKTTGKKSAAATDEDSFADVDAEIEKESEEDTNSFGDNDDDDTFAEEPPPKKVAAKKVKETDVMDACKAYAKKHTLDVAKALLKKKFGTASVKGIPEEKWAAVISAMKV